MDHLLFKSVDFDIAVTTVNQAKQALQILRENKNKFDLVISDVWMPEMNGFQLLQQLAHEMDLPVVSKYQLLDFCFS